MSASLDSLQRAVHFHRLGHLAQATQCYRQVLEIEPGNADAHHLLGMAALEQSQHQVAIEHLKNAIAIHSAAAPFHHHLGVAYLAVGDKQAAIECYRRALAIEPRSALVYKDLGDALSDAGQPAAAEDSYRKALQIDPQFVEAYNNLGNMLQNLGRPCEALASLQMAAQVRMDLAEIQFNLANCYKAQGMLAEAAAAYRRAIAINPRFSLAHHNLGLLLQTEREFAAAADCHREALRLTPDCAHSHAALGVALQALGDIAQAKACYLRALELKPADPHVTMNLATALRAEGKLDEAAAHCKQVLAAASGHIDALYCLGEIALTRGELSMAEDCFARVIDIDPQHADAHSGRAGVYLARGEFLVGWPDFEYRLHSQLAPTAVCHDCRWDGSPLAGRTLLVTADDGGLGDVLQFVRYDSCIRRRGGQVLWAVPRRLIPLLRQSDFNGLVAIEDPRPRFDVQISLLSLPAVFQTTLETIPAETPYLFADPHRVAAWAAQLASFVGLKVGIHWQGNPIYPIDRYRSMSLSCFAPLSRVAGVNLISLQKGFGSEQIAEVAGQFTVHALQGLDDQEGAFLETASVMKNLDLVVTSDSAVAHLAGALGVKVWLAVSAAPEWRWLIRRDDSPWYPTMRLFRQSEFDRWPTVFDEIAGELSHIAT